MNKNTVYCSYLYYGLDKNIAPIPIKCATRVESGFVSDYLSFATFNFFLIYIFLCLISKLYTSKGMKSSQIYGIQFFLNLIKVKNAVFRQ
jgi:hypothetical protein